MLQRSGTAGVFFWAVVVSVAFPFAVVAALKAGVLAAVGIMAFGAVVGYCMGTCCL
jgi:hypothetical protein